MRNQTKGIGIIAPFPPPLGGMAIQAGKLVKNLRADGFDVVQIPTNPVIPQRLRPIENLWLIRTMARVILLLNQVRRECRRVDVFYFLTGFFDFFFWVTVPVLLLLKLKGKRVVLSARGGDAGRFFKRWKLLAKIPLKIPRTITVPTGFLQKAFTDHLQMKTIVVPNIADLDQFHFRKRSQVLPRFIVTRHLEEMYNIDCVVRAFRIISDVYPDSLLTIVGGGSRREQLQQLTHSLGLNGNVVFAGRVSHDQLPALYDSHDILLNASNIDNMPGAILEAFASGLPVVTTRAGGIPFLVEHEKTGFLVELNDSKALAQYAIRLIQSPETARMMARNANEYVQSCSWPNVRSILIPLLQQSH